MSAQRTERLLNLVICLLSTRRYLTAQQVRQMVPGYGAGDNEAFKRMFERDKEELRELGIPLETGSHSVWEDEPGYRIAARDYELPEISLSAEEAAAVGLAARLWAQAGLAEAASSALMKLRAAGIDAASSALGELEPHVEATDAAFEPLLDALHTGQAVDFDYRAGPAAPTEQRSLDPWGVVSWHGRWYVVGHDRDRAATRVFRLSRIVGAVRTTGPLVTYGGTTWTCAATSPAPTASRPSPATPRCPCAPGRPTSCAGGRARWTRRRTSCAAGTSRPSPTVTSTGWPPP